MHYWEGEYGTELLLGTKRAARSEKFDSNGRRCSREKGQVLGPASEYVGKRKVGSEERSDRKLASEERVAVERSRSGGVGGQEGSRKKNERRRRERRYSQKAAEGVERLVERQTPSVCGALS